MTVTLELKPEVEAAARTEAQAKGLLVEAYLQSFLEQTLLRPAEEEAETIRHQRMDILSRLQGKYYGMVGSSEEFAAQKAEEKAREERHWRNNEG